jgi:hypothetical protein
MSDFRRWRLSANHPLSLQIAADARLSQTDYVDDQAWELALGTADGPALNLHTRLGMRAGMISLVPMWLIDGRPVYQAQTYTHSPEIESFAPAYVRARARLTPQLDLIAEYWAMDSHAIGGRFTLHNRAEHPLELQLDLVGFAASAGKEIKLALLPVQTGGHALSFGKIGGVYPLVVLEHKAGTAAEPGSSSKISARLRVAPGAQTSIRWVHAARADVSASLTLAQRWLKQNWDAHIKRAAQAAAFIPTIETGDSDRDAVIAFAYQQLVQSFLRPTSSLPAASFVAARTPATGFSPNGSGSDHIRSWSGQNPTAAYLSALAVASIAPAWAAGVLENYLSAQAADGWIDWKPGLAGQRQGILALPILARLAWGVFHYTENTEALRTQLPALVRFFERWLEPDLDADGDGLPEWQSENQTGYPFMPTFAVGLPYGQHADIRMIEAPDLAAYLLSEAISLREIAYFLRDADAEARMAERVDSLKAVLESLWLPDVGRYGYRDRDSHLTQPGAVLLAAAPGDQEHFLAETLPTPARLIIEISGGVEHVPSITLDVHGVDANGQPIHETAGAEAFFWSHGRGVHTTRSLFAQVDRVRVDGLVRVYQVAVKTLDTSQVDLSAALPIWSVGITPERAADLARLITDPAHFWRANGVSMTPLQSESAPADGSADIGGVHPFWLTLIGEGLIEYGHGDAAAELVKRLLNAQVTVLKTQGSFYEFYDAETARGLGERGHVGGLVPLHLLGRVLGVRVISTGKVWTGGLFHWGEPIVFTQHGVRIERSAEGTTVHFPSGHQAQLPADAPWQEVIDPNPAPPPSIAAPPSRSKPGA